MKKEKYGTASTMVLENNEYFALVQEEMHNGNKVVFTAKGHSMTPFLRHERDSVELVLPNEENVKEHAIVLFTLHGRYIMHRILKIDYVIPGAVNDKDVLTIQGDGNIKGQEIVTRDAVIGVVAKLLRKGRNGSYHAIDCKGRFFRIATAIWLFLTPARRYILAVRRRTLKYILHYE